MDLGSRPSIQASGRNAIVALSPLSWFTSSLSVATNTSPPECFQLLPSIATTAVQSRNPEKSTQVWLRYLSQILSHPSDRVPSSQQQQQRSGRRARRSSHPPAIAAEKHLCPSIIKSTLQAIAPRRLSLRNHSNRMGTKSLGRRPSVSFHMETRSRTAKITPEPTDASTADSSPSSLSSLSTPPSTPPKTANSRKRKLSDSGSDDTENSSETKRLARRASTASSRSASATPRKQTPQVPAFDSVLVVTKTDSAPPQASSSASPLETARTLRRSSRIARSGASEPINDPGHDETPSSSSPERTGLANARDGKSSEGSSSNPATPPKPVRASQSAKETTANKANISFQEYKDKEFWPEFDAKNPTYYANDATTRYRPAENGDTPESRSPRKPARRGGRGGAHANGGGRGKGKSRGRGGRAGGESPEPPNRRRPLTQEEKLEISIIKARQLELKRFFNTVGAQQIDILEQLSGRDVAKITRKPKAHRHVPEYDGVVEELEAAMKDVQELMRTRFDLQVEHEKQRMQQEEEVIEAQFQSRVTEARKEHLGGAEGDIILFERAYRAAHDDTHTESGSDMDYFPHYHELPEPNTQPRGYSSRKIMDEKPFKQQLESYDEQARQQVLNEDVIGPLLKQMEQRNNEWRTEQLRKKSQTLDALSAEASKELENINGYLIPRPLNMAESNSYALSALADVSDWVAQQHPERQYIYMPLAQGDVLPRQALDFSPLAGQAPSSLPPPPPPPAGPSYHVIRPDSRGRGRRSRVAPPNNAPPAGHVATPPPPSTQPVQPAHSPLAPPIGPASFLPPRLISSGPGQPIAPAPPKPAPPHRSSTNINVFRHSPRPSVHQHAMARHNSLGSPLPNGPQQYIFQPPQQPYQHQSAPGPAPTPQYGPHPASPLGSGPGANNTTATTAGAVPSVSAGTGVSGVNAPPSSGGGSGSGGNGPTMQVIGQQTKIPMTFVNQTIASRNAAAAAAANANTAANVGPGANAQGNGKRVLLPKM